jgi:hypothetical protein
VPCGHCGQACEALGRFGRLFVCMWPFGGRCRVTLEFLASIVRIGDVYSEYQVLLCWLAFSQSWSWSLRARSSLDFFVLFGFSVTCV